MAMLAEPRQRKRYNLVPKGKALFEDGDRFGTKMLEKMGWSKGKGLGRDENGQQEFVRVRYKNDANGLGFEDRDDQWTQHEKHFNGLLENLNGGDSTVNSTSNDGDVSAAPTVGLGFQSKSASKGKLKDKFSGQSLEEKSKNSKARVHYKKFTKGKDMSQYSEKDLANIFGKKATPDDVNIYTQFQSFGVVFGENKDEEKEESVKKTPIEIGTHIINTGVSVTDYFKLKMAKLKRKEVENEVEVKSSNLEDEAPAKKKKSKKRRADDEADEADSAAGEEEVVYQKKKKSKTQVGPDCVLSSEVEIELPQPELDGLNISIIPEVANSRKKKTRKQIVSGEVNGKANGFEEAELSLEKCKEPSEGAEITGSNVEESASSKKKKSKKQKGACEKNHIIVPSVVEEADLPLEEKSNESMTELDAFSKKKKTKNQLASAEVNGTTDEAELIPKKKSKKPLEEAELNDSIVQGDISFKKKKQKKEVVSCGESETVAPSEVRDLELAPIQKKLVDAEPNESEAQENVPSKKRKSKKQVVSGTKRLNPAEVSSVIQSIPVKKKKSKEAIVIVVESDIEEENEIGRVDVTVNPFSKKKKFKQLPVENTTEYSENKSASALLEPIVDEVSLKTKKNKKKPVGENEPSEYVIEKSILPTVIPIKKTKAPEEPIENVSASNKSSNKKKDRGTSEEFKQIPSEVSPNHDLIDLKDNCLLDTFTLSTFCAEKFRNIKFDQFVGSNISEICGYGLSENLKLDIKSVKGDQERIMMLWSGTLDKYQFAAPKRKIYNTYRIKALQARRTKNKLPKIKVKCLKRRNVFELL